MANAGGDRETEPDGRAAGAYSVVFSLVYRLSSILLPTLLFSSSSMISFLRDRRGVTGRDRRSSNAG